MTVLDARVRPQTVRTARTRRYVMCRPDFFAVEYAINPWMVPGVAVNHARAIAQWEQLVKVYAQLGHDVQQLRPEPGLPDMVFAANGALVVGGRAYGAQFRHPERQGEAAAHARFLRLQGITVTEPQFVNEGEGDFLALDSMILAGTGFRTSIEAHIDAASVLDRAVVSLELVNPRYYHLDTSIEILDDGTGEAPADIAYIPEAFSAHSRRTLKDLFPHALQISEADAAWLALNVVSDGQHVVLPAQAKRFATAVAARGYTPIPIDLSEFIKAGGSVKCCTLELHP